MAKPAAFAKGAAGSSRSARSASSSASTSRKRALEQPLPDSEDELELDGTLPQGEGEGESEDDEEYEIDEGSSNGDLEDFEDEEEDVPANGARRVPRADENEDENGKDSSDDADFVDEDSGDEEGYNSSDIDAMTDNTSVSSSSRPSRKAAARAGSPTLDELIAQHTVKPDEGADTLGDYARGEAGPGGARFSQAKVGNGRMVRSKLVEGGWKREYEDIEAGYGSESSTEDNPNTVGNIPMEWYDDLPHIGYSVDGKKIMRPAKGDELDKFLATVEDPDSWTTAEDKLLQKQVQLSDKELDIIRRLQNAENPDAGYDPYQPTVEWFTGKGQEMAMPLSAAPEPKRRFVPSKWEHKKVMKIVRAIREGRIVPNKPAATRPKVYAIWSNTDQENAPHAMYMPAPQLPPPKTIESYNPPEEYLFDEEEKKEWEEAEKEDRKTSFMPQKYGALRNVPGYKDLVQERFERCLDLYLAPRTRKVKLNIDPESLVPKLPHPRELRPFPIACAVQYRHPASSRVRTVSVDPKGEWVASGSEDGLVRIWDLGNGREVWRWNLKAGAVQAVEWSSNADECILAALVAGRVYILAPLVLTSPAIAQQTLTHINTGFSYTPPPPVDGIQKAPDAKWTRPTEAERDRGILVMVEVQGTPKQVTWHRKGDYFSTVAIEAQSKAVLIHQLSKHQSQSPFKKSKGAVQRVAFHPLKPHFFVATQRYVRQYDLAAQKLLKTLTPGLKWISSLDIHPQGDNLIVGSYDKKLCWFDLDLSTKPYKTLRYHTKALRSVAYHRRYPLFASSSDDGSIHIFHGTVYSDLNQNPLIVPLKVLKGHAVKDGLGVLDMRWHPTKPWLVSSGADGEVRLWCS